MDGIEGSWAIIASALAVGLAGLIAATFTTLREAFPVWLKRRITRRTYAEMMAKLSAFSEELEALRKIPSVDQVVVMCGHNCGGLPTPGKPYTVEAIQGWQRCPESGACIDPCRRYRRGLQVDAHYTRMLEDLVKEGLSIQVTDKIPPEAKLRGYFELDGIVACTMFYLGLHGDELIFASIASSKGEFSAREKLEINDRVATMRSLVGTQED